MKHIDPTLFPILYIDIRGNASVELCSYEALREATRKVAVTAAE